ncbi:MAG: hypothetical protein IKQ60_04100 [Candidatus Methanomethylophilaceae archaeon]|nr:hypothetical protein [Candidatus Methanomethylophilaceae archaeon]
MREGMKRALLRSYDLRKQAGDLQIEKGTVDIGLRSQVTSGKHMDEIASHIVLELENMGVDKNSIYAGNKNVDIPGWFRAIKKWDVLAFKDSQLITGIELKSISGSYGNNINNRVEEAIGEAIDAKYANDRGLINHVTPPLMAYALIVKKDSESSSNCKKLTSHHFDFDPVFENTSYIDRFRIMCERLRRENIYGAVWFVVVEPITGKIEEPVKELSYDTFLAEIEGRVKTFYH